MTDRGRLADRARTFFDDLWKEGDPWGFETSHYDHESYAIQLALVSDRRYASALEIGCGSGTFSRRLAPVTDRLLSIDVAPAARVALDVCRVQVAVQWLGWARDWRPPANNAQNWTAPS